MTVYELITKSFETDSIVHLGTETVKGYVIVNDLITVFTDSSERDIRNELRFRKDQEVIMLDGKLHSTGINFHQDEVMVDFTIFTENNGFFQSEFTL